jgi:pyruvate/2-oxoglutarate dehydrogenase complex dihydrolipoamide dehydrogenase (E3) component
MPVDYDLVVIGGTTAGVEAAIFAAKFKARVALVTQAVSFAALPDSLLVSALTQLGQTAELSQHLPRSPLWHQASAPPTLDWQAVKPWIQAIAHNLDARHSPSALATLGIDIISDSGEFCRKPAPGFLVDKRLLRSRAYLLAPAHHLPIPTISGLSTAGYQTLTTLLQLADLPASLAIVGSTTVAIELAQTLQRLGCQITLLMTTAQLLNEADREISQLIQAQLEAEGVQVWLNTSVTEIKFVNGKKTVQFGTQDLITDDVLLVTEPAPNVETWNLEAVGVQTRNHGILRNSKLQTANPTIYICEGRTRHSLSAHLATYEAKLAVKNALFFANQSTHYRSLPFTTHTSPTAAWIGLTDHQAIEQYGKDILILRHPFYTLPQAQIHSNLTGFCKLIVQRDGTLLGAHIVGSSAEEFIGAIAIAFQQRLKIQTLADLIVPSASFAEIIQQTAAQWQRVRLIQRPRWQDLLEAFFDIQRSRSK